VHTAQGISGLIVIEFRNSANRLPRVRGMAVLTGSGQISVGTVAALVRLRLRSSGHSGKQQKNCQIKDTARRRHDSHLDLLATVLKETDRKMNEG
jgi:hypothetical protein